MSVSNGEDADETTLNTSFMSREVDTSTVAKIDLLDAGSANITDLQLTLQGEAAEVDSTRTLTGTSEGDDDLGTFSGSTISDNTTIKPGMQELETEVELKEDAANKGIADGYASLDGSARLPLAQLPTSAMEFNGAWNAFTNTPTLIDGTGTNGDFFRVSVAGTQDLGSGSETYAIGDTTIFNGTIWQKIPADDSVSSVNGNTGTVVLDIDDVTPTTTKGDIIVEDGLNAVRFPIGTNGQVLTANSVITEGVEWQTPSVTSTDKDVEVFNSSDTLDADNDVALCDASGGGFNITLPTAVGAIGKVYDIIKTDSSINQVVMLTTSGQTIGIRSSTSIRLNVNNDSLSVVSNGTNWDILFKRETEFSTANASGTTNYSGRTTGDFLASSTDLLLNEGIFKLRSYYSVDSSNGTSIGLNDATGLYSADGANNSTTPALLSAGANVSFVLGEPLMGAYSTILPLSLPVAQNFQRHPAGNCVVIIGIDGGTQSVFAVPNIAFSTTGSAACVPLITAERLD